MGVCIKKHFLTCFQQAHSGLRSLTHSDKHGDVAGSLPPEPLNISTDFTFTLKKDIDWTYRASVGGFNERHALKHHHFPKTNP